MMRVFILVIASFPPRVLRAKRADHWQQDGSFCLHSTPLIRASSSLLQQSGRVCSLARSLFSAECRWHNFRPATKSDSDGASKVKVVECYVIFMQTIPQIEQFSYEPSAVTRRKSSGGSRWPEYLMGNRSVAAFMEIFAVGASIWLSF